MPPALSSCRRGRRPALLVGPSWALPAYELALMTARQVQGMGQEPELFVLTPEPSPLSVFGSEASQAVGKELASVGISVRTNAYVELERSHPDPLVAIIEPAHERLPLSRAVALPRQLGPGLLGVPSDAHGFLDPAAADRPHGVFGSPGHAVVTSPTATPGRGRAPAP